MSWALRVSPRALAFIGALAILASALVGHVVTPSSVQAATTIELEQTGQAASVGGSGGNAFSPVYCPTGYIAVGIRGAQSPHSFGSGGHWITQIGLVCQQIDFESRGLTTTGYSTVITGGGNTAGQESILCPSGQVLVGLQMTADSSLGYNVLKTAEPQCQSVSFGDPSAPTAPLLSGAIYDVGNAFGSQYGGALPTASCSSGQFILGFGGRVGAALDLFTPYCGRFKTAAPTITSPATVSSAIPTLLAPLSVSAAFAGGPTPAVTYQWYRCTASGVGGTAVPGDCELITGATSSSYTPGPEDAGKYLRGAAIATNGYGTLTSVSAAVGPTSVPTPTVDLPAVLDTGISSSDNLTSISSPSIQVGGLVVGATVSVEATDGVTTVHCAPFVAASASESCALPELSPDGAWSLNVTQTVSSVPSPVATLVVTVDTSAPLPPSSLALAAASDTGAASDDSVTKDVTPSIELTGLEVGSRVVVTASKPGAADVTCEIANVTSTSQACTFVSPLTADGEWTFAAIQIDDAGNASESSSSITAVLDTSAGVALTSSPVATGLSATASTSFAFTATLTDPPAGASSFTSSDVTLAGTSTGWSIDPASWTQVSATEYTFVVSAGSPTRGTLVVKVPSGSYDDTAGNSASGTVGPDWTSTIVVEPPAGAGPPSITALTGSTTTLGSTLSSSAGTWDDKGDISPATAYHWQICDDSSATTCVDVAGATSATYVPTSAAEGRYVRSVVTRTNVKGATEQVAVAVGPMTKSPQEIDFANPGTKTYSPTPFTVSPRSEFPASADLTGLTVQMSSLTPDVCTVSGFSVTTLKAGNCTLAASQPGSGEFEAATQVTQTFTVNRASDSSVTQASSSQVQPGDSFTLSTVNSSAGDDTYVIVSGPCSVSGNVVTATGGTGDCVISTSSAADDRYNASTAPNITVKVRNTDAITLPALDDTLVSAGSFPVVAVSVSGRIPSMTAGPAGVCSYSAGRVVPAGPGTCTVTATVTDNGSWSDATATESFTFVAPPTAPTINSVRTAAADGILGGTAQVYFTPGPDNGSTLVNYTVTATPVGGGVAITVTCLVSPCTVPGLAAVGHDFTVTTHATAVGTSVSATSSPARATVLALHPITLPDPGPRLLEAGPFSVSPMSNVDDSWIPVLISMTPGVCTTTGFAVTPITTGTCTLVASHSGGVHGGVTYGLGSSSVTFAITRPFAWPPAPDPVEPEPPVGPCAATGECACPCDPEDPRDPDPADPTPNKPSKPTRPDTMQPPPPPAVVTITRDGGRKVIVEVVLPATKPGRVIEVVVIAILDRDGNVLRRLDIPVTRGMRTLAERIVLPQGGTVKVYTTNSAGVSNRAPAGANVVQQQTVVGKRDDGRPILYGKKIAKPVFFGPDSPELDARARGILDDVARYVGKHGGTVLITGFVRKGQGSEKYRKELSAERAVQVAQYLSDLGVDTWIRYDGAGAYREIDPRVSDRRVEIRWAKTGLQEPDRGARRT